MEQQQTRVAAAADFLQGGGEMGERIRAHDWAATPLGPPPQWPQSLKTAVRIMLTSRQAMFVWWGPQLINLYNDAYKSIVGGKHPQALGQPAQAVWHEIWADVGPRADRAMRLNEGTYDEALLLVMERYGYREETYYTFSYSPIPSDDGSPGGIICANTDDTRRIVGERQLKLLRELAASTADARSYGDACASAAASLGGDAQDLPFALIYLVDGDGAQARLAGSAGIDPSHVAAPATTPLDGLWPLGQALQDEAPVLLDPLGPAFGPLPGGAWDEPATQAVVLPIPASGRAGQAGLLVVGLNPLRRWSDDYRGFLTLVAGQIGSAIAHAQAYEEERRRAEALAEIDRAKTAFFSNVSHEFRTPLALLLGPLDELRQQAGQLDPAARELLGLAQRNGKRLLKLVNTLLDFSRIEAGRAQAQVEPVDLAAVTADLASVFRSAVEKAGMQLVVDCPPLPRPVPVDRDMWEKIVLNLLSNAFKYTLAGSIEVSLRAEEGQAVLRVKDTGIGIPADELPRLFERFHRVAGARGRTHEGSGIGLALVQELARLQHGDVTVQSQLGEGSCFTVHLPLGAVGSGTVAAPALASTRLGAAPFVEEALRWLPDGGDEPEASLWGGLDDAPQPVLDHAAPAARRPRVLLADDNADMRDYVRRLLAPAYDVTAVADGEAALQAARAQRPDLLLSDVMMPRRDGFSLLQVLRSDVDTAALPIILLSARAGEEARIEGLAAGADDYIVKPFSARELLARVAAALSVARLRREAVRVSSGLNRISQALATELDIAKIVQAVTDGATELTGAGFGAFFYNETDERGESRALYALSGVSREAFDGFPMPRNTAVFAPTFAGQGVVRLADVTADPRHGREAPHHGMPLGHLPVRSYLAVPVVSGGGQVLGGLFLGHPKPGLFNARHEDLVVGVAAQAAMAIDNSRLYAQLRESAQRLAEADRRKDEFLATLAHELRNPLAPLRNSLEILNRDALPDDMKQRARSIMSRQVAQMGRLIDELIDISRITSGKIDLTREAVDLAAVVEAAIEIARPVIDERGQRLSVTLPPEPVTLDIDRTRMAQVLSNLLNNAARYSEPNAAIRLQASLDGGGLRVAVEDEGQGLAPDMLPRVFEMFMQVPRGGQPQAGLGVGLTLARRLVELHGGTLVAHSAGLGRGSQFVLQLPPDCVRIEPPAVAADGQSAAEPAVAARRVLVVDDNIDAAESLAALLEHDGHEVHVAHDGEQALQAVQRLQPRVVLLDIGLPRLDGYEVARRIRLLPGGEAIGLVATTGWGQQKDRERSHGAGFDHHLVKPVDPDAIRRLIGQLVEMPAQPQPVALSKPASPAANAPRVLVADDNDLVRESFVQLLSAEGYDVQSAVDGLQAVEMAEAWTPDVVLLDIHMPRLSGLEAARRLRASPALPHVTLLMMSGMALNEAWIRHAKAAGFDDCLDKTADPQQWLARLRQVAGGAAVTVS
jgi:signal transduction histidine kinase/DNA-binding response OmpR family regulator